MPIFRETELDYTEVNKIVPYHRGDIFIKLMPDMTQDMILRHDT